MYHAFVNSEDGGFLPFIGNEILEAAKMLVEELCAQWNEEYINRGSIGNFTDRTPPLTR